MIHSVPFRWIAAILILACPKGGEGLEQFKRADRIGALLRNEISNIIREDVKDPRMGMLSVTKVDVTDDLKHAKVYISPLREEDADVIFACLKSARGFIQKRLGRTIKMRYTPVIEFHKDDSIKYGAHIMEILEGLKRDKEQHEE